MSSELVEVRYEQIVLIEKMRWNTHFLWLQAQVLYSVSGLFFILPCMDNIKVIDLRTITYDVPPQEVC